MHDMILIFFHRLAHKHFPSLSLSLSLSLSNVNRAEKAGVTILNEIGLDPGIDHLRAMQIMDDVKAQGGQVPFLLGCDAISLFCIMRCIRWYCFHGL